MLPAFLTNGRSTRASIVVSKTIDGGSNPSARAKEKDMTKVVNYISEAFEELKSNVTWPEWSEVQHLTVVVAVFSVLFALATWGVDTVFAKVLGVFFNWLKA